MKTEGSKKCGRCKSVKNLNEFYKNASHKDGFSDYCKECHNTTTRERKAKKAKNMILNIADFTDESLFSEIRKRGYSGNLTYTQSIAI